MKVIDTLGPRENLEWCKPYYKEDGDKYAISCDGKIIAAFVGGKEVAVDTIVDDDECYNDYYDKGRPLTEGYLRWRGDYKECGCKDCPCRSYCEAVNEEVEE